MVPKWEIALNKFIKKWERQKKVTGALLTGSYVTGTPSKYSDIDIYIVLSDDMKTRERGNRIIDGYLMEYFANPVRQIKAYFKEEFEKNKSITARMFATGKVLFDKKGDVKALRKEAERWMRKKFRKPDKASVEISKYSLWDDLDNLKELHSSKSVIFRFAYFFLLQEIMNVYSKYLQIEIVAPSKLLKYLTSEQFRKKYILKEFPDKTFARLFVKCLKKDDMGLIKNLTNYVLDKLGGFDIDGWKLRSRTTI